MISVQNLLNQIVFNNTLANWALALGLAILVWFALKFLRQLISKRLGKRYEQTQTLVDDILFRVSQRTWTYLRIAAAIYTISLSLKVSTAIHTLAIATALLLSIFQSALWGTDIINLWVMHRVKQDYDKDRSIATKMSALGIISKVGLWTILFLLALDNLPNVQINSLIASLGVGSMAVALAVQNILSDLFASLSIVLDKPFEIGDFINVGDYNGSVEHIGLKTTRLRSLTGEQIVLGNNDLLNSRIRNYKRMNQRRVAFTLGVSPDTPYETLIQIPTMLQNIVEAQPETNFDRAHFKNYGDFTLDFEVVYLMPSTDFRLFMDTQQVINLEIFRQFTDAGITLPYPTQTIHVKHET
jgi:small-conductance mechanosensitive channel